MKRVSKRKLILESVCYPRSSLHSYLKSCQPPSSELVAGVALVARLTALLDQFPQQVFIDHDFFPFPTELCIFEYSAINSQVLPTALKESVHHLASLLPTIESKAAHAVAKLIETWLGSFTSSLTCNIFFCRCSREFPERDTLAATSLPFLIAASLVDSASKADVKRVRFFLCCPTLSL